MKNLLAELIRRNAIDPRAFLYHPPTELLLPTILGHLDGNPSTKSCTRTECPGDVLYSMLPAIRSDVAEAIRVPLSPRRRAARP